MDLIISALVDPLTPYQEIVLRVCTCALLVGCGVRYDLLPPHQLFLRSPYLTRAEATEAAALRLRLHRPSAAGAVAGTLAPLLPGLARRALVASAAALLMVTRLFEIFLAAMGWRHSLIGRCTFAVWSKVIIVGVVLEVAGIVWGPDQCTLPAYSSYC